MRAWIAAILFMVVAPTALAQDCHTATPMEAKAMAERATAYLDEVGPETAFRKFMERGGPYIKGDLYVFVIDLNGVLWVNGAFPRSIGTDASMAEDSQGRRYIQEMIQTAKAKDEGLVEYEWFNPCTGKMAQKLTYFYRNGGFIVGVGAYGLVSL